MRQNPNIIMVGEIRDPETAKVAIEASMTGHLVLSTIHANSAAGAIARFVGLGVDRQALASSIECTMGQRLVRKICPHCKVEEKLDEETLTRVKLIIEEIKKVNKNIVIPNELKFYRGKGCEKCGGVGFKGRLGIYEIIEMQDNIQKVIQGVDVTNHDIEQAAMDNGTLLMLQDGILKAINGDTSVGEVFRVVD
jgi:type II secretory ATPase GspE/PulE/Tfp pilus assembly ATPase PilB-like protein